MTAPAGHPPIFDNAMIVTVMPDDKIRSVGSVPEGTGERWIIGSTRESPSLQLPHIYGWNSRCNLEFDEPATDDFPGQEMARSRWSAFHQMRIPEGAVVPIPSKDRTKALLIREFSHHHPSVVRILEFTGQESDPIEQTFSVYHEGHFTDVHLTPGPTEEAPLVWMAGVVSGGGLVPEALKAVVHDKIRFIACMEFTPGTHVFPPYLEADDTFPSNHPEGVSAANVLFYLTVQGCKVVEDMIDWKDYHAFDIQYISRRVEDDAVRYELLTSTSVSLDVEFSDSDSLVLCLDEIGDVRALMHRRAAVLGVPFEPMMKAFLRDSVFALAFAREDIRINAGPARDVRDHLTQ